MDLESFGRLVNIYLERRAVPGWEDLMRITEGQLRRIIREEVGRLQEAQAADDWSAPELTDVEILFIQDPANERSLKTHLMNLMNKGIDIEGNPGPPGRIHNNIYYSLSDFEGDGSDAVTLRRELRNVMQIDRTAENPYSNYKLLNKRSR